jgi:ribonuclease P protein component
LNKTSHYPKSIDKFSYFWDSFFQLFSMSHRNTFSKSEHLCGETKVLELFTKGDAFMVYPFRVVYQLLQCPTSSKVMLLISVPKKRFKRAVSRNRIKRLMREAYRLNKHMFKNEELPNKQVHFALQYIADVELDFETIDKKMQQVIHKLMERWNNSEIVSNS